MPLLYRLFLGCYQACIWTAAAFGHEKARLWIDGRRGWRDTLKSWPEKEERVWFHCASLGEFEQGRPVMEAWKERHPSHRIVLTFFSPSGYEIRKKYAGADYVLYLPLDGPASASAFVNAVRPVAAIFVKYEFWHYYFKALAEKQIPVYCISAIFRPEQPFFRWYGSFFRKMLRRITMFFVQDNASASLLASIGLQQVTVSGDTRFDRVAAVAKQAVAISQLEEFSTGALVLVAGSTWPADEAILSELLNQFPGLRLLIAPHEVSDHRIDELRKRFPEAATLSGEIPSGTRVVIVDSMGQLSSLYRYGKYAWVGGGYGKGIHNILEAAVYGVPVMFGTRYEKFNEATELVQLGGAFSIQDVEAAAGRLRSLEDGGYAVASQACAAYVSARAGATKKILDVIDSSRR